MHACVRAGTSGVWQVSRKGAGAHTMRVLPNGIMWDSAMGKERWWKTCQRWASGVAEKEGYRCSSLFTCSMRLHQRLLPLSHAVAHLRNTSRKL